MAKKGRKKKNNNPYGIPNEIANEIRDLPNEALISRTTGEYRNWKAVEKQKKEDSQLSEIKKTLSELNAEIKEHPEYLELQEKLQAKEEELLSEELEKYLEMRKDLSSGYRDEIKRLKGMFYIAIEELGYRKAGGLLAPKP
jgi:DNA-binding transcriptional regulator GbsR (MarR family)